MSNKKMELLTKKSALCDELVALTNTCESSYWDDPFSDEPEWSISNRREAFEQKRLKLEELDRINSILKTLG